MRQGAAAKVVPAHQPVRLRVAAIELEVTSDNAAFLDGLAGRYGDCAVVGSAPAALRCNASPSRDGAYLELEFSGAPVPNPFDSALTPFLMLRHLQGRVVQDHPGPGWRALVQEGAPGMALLQGDSTRLRVRLDNRTRDLAVDCLISVAFSAQPDVLFLHAASFAVGGRGALLIGPARSGKSSTVLGLVSRGHEFLGDDLAAVHATTAELLPFPKSAGLREGPQATAIEARARTFRAMPGTGIDGIPRKYVRVGDMFAACGRDRRPLDCVFILEGFAEGACLRPYQPRLHDVARLRAAVSENVPGWGHSAGEDLVKFLRVTDLLSRARCYLLELGSLDGTAMLIEQAMGNP